MAGSNATFAVVEEEKEELERVKEVGNRGSVRSKTIIKMGCLFGIDFIGGIR